MVTKGLDFDHVSVVGILSADTLLNYPDFMVIVDYTRDSKILTCLYENNYLAYLMGTFLLLKTLWKLKLTERNVLRKWRSISETMKFAV